LFGTILQQRVGDDQFRLVGGIVAAGELLVIGFEVVVIILGEIQAELGDAIPLDSMVTIGCIVAL